MKFLCALLATSSTLFAQVVEGTVVNSLTGTPIIGVAVTLESPGNPAYQATTDAQGAFRIEAVKPGSYTANFSKTDFLALDRDAPARRPFSVATGSDPVRLQAKLTPLGKVLGRVLDANGDPVPGADLLLDSTRTGLSKTSDKEGKFSFQVAPGRYVLLARPPTELKPPASGKDERLGWLPTYYPGVLDARAAARIVVGNGAELWGHDIQLRAAPLRRVRGVILDTKGDPAPHVAVRAARTDETLTEDVAAVSADDGSFEFPSLYDGEWSIFAQQESNGVKLMAFAAVQVSDRDLDRLELRLTPPFTVRGSAALAGTAWRGDKIGIFLRPPVVAGSQGLSQGFTDRDGNFKIENVYPGKYKIIVNSPGPPYFLASLAIAEHDVLGQYVEFDSGAFPIQIVFDSKGGGVRGKVEDCGGATIVLAPQEKALQEPQLVQTAKCSDGGRFEIANLRPGDYYAFAFDRWEGPLDLLASLDQTLVNKAVGVRVGRGEVATIDLRVISREP